MEIAHRHMNLENGTEAKQFPEKEYNMGFSLWCTDLTAEYEHSDRVIPNQSTHLGACGRDHN